MDPSPQRSVDAETVYRLSSDGILVPPFEVSHRGDEYDPAGFDVLAKMQDHHFWYRGRHRWLLHALRRELRRTARPGRDLPAAIDLGGGCGGWVKCLRAREGAAFSEIALSDSSLTALRMARAALGDDVLCYRTDLMRLGWNSRWDVTFLLDVIEHLPDDVEAFHQVRAALRPGGLLFLTVPAMRFFWSYNDEAAAHLRRYSKRDVEALGRQAGLRLVRSRYLMFVTSPLLYLARRFPPDLRSMNAAEVRAHVARTHQTPPAPINGLLDAALTVEEAFGRWIPYPWGTSLLAVFEKRET